MAVANRNLPITGCKNSGSDFRFHPSSVGILHLVRFTLVILQVLSNEFELRAQVKNATNITQATNITKTSHMAVVSKGHTSHKQETLRLNLRLCRSKALAQTSNSKVWVLLVLQHQARDDQQVQLQRDHLHHHCRRCQQRLWGPPLKPILSAKYLKHPWL